MSDAASSGAGFDLAGKVVLVTGAARRIGRSIALRLHREGARVLIHYSSSQAEAAQTAAECGGASLYRANLESIAEIKAMFDESPLAKAGSTRWSITRQDSRPSIRWRSPKPIGTRSTTSTSKRLLLRPAGRIADAPQSRGAGRIVNMSSMGAFLAGLKRALLCLQGGRRGLDASPGQGPGAGHHGQLRCAA